MRLGITGHRGLSAQVERMVREALDAELRQYDPAELVGVSCIADGPDTWFAEAVLDSGGRIEVVIPAEQYREGLPESQHATYDKLLARAAEVHHTAMRESTSQAHMTGSEILVGLVDRLVAVWDGQAGPRVRRDGGRRRLRTAYRRARRRGVARGSHPRLVP